MAYDLKSITPDTTINASAFLFGADSQASSTPSIYAVSTLRSFLFSSPTLVTPNLGTPSAGTLTNCTGLPIVNGTTGTLSVSRGGTGVTSLTAGYIPFGAGTGELSSSASLFWDSANSRLGVGTATPAYTLDVFGAGKVSGALTLGVALGVASGGTGLSSLTAGYIPFGNGASALSSSANLFWDSSNTRLGIGNSSPSASLDVRSAAAGIQLVVGDATADATGKIGRIASAHYTNSQKPVGVFVMNSASAANALVIGGGSSVVNAATYIAFNTALTNTTATGTERLRITDAGNIHPAAGATSMANGFIYMPSAAGAPSGTPTSITGTVPFYYDTTNNQFYVYNGTWKKVALA